MQRTLDSLLYKNGRDGGAEAKCLAQPDSEYSVGSHRFSTDELNRSSNRFKMMLLPQDQPQCDRSPPPSPQSTCTTTILASK